MSISEKQIDAIEQQLFARMHQRGQTVQPNVYAILDGARDKRIEPMLNNGDLPSACLYKGKISYAMKRAAPHIVQLEKGHALTRKILAMAWGNAWGIFALCAPDVSISSVVNNCRRIAKAKLPDGKLVIFRYYDPRIARLLLPACNESERDHLFGAASALLMESEDPLNYWVFECGDTEAPVIATRACMGEAPVKLHCDSGQPLKRPLHGLLHMRQAHLDALQDKLDREELALIKQVYVECYLADEQTEDSAEQAAAEIKPLTFSVCGREVSFDTFLRLCYNKAKGFNLHSRVSLLHFIHMNHQYGWSFWRKDAYRWVENILCSERPAEAKTEAISKEFSRRLMEKVWG